MQPLQQLKRQLKGELHFDTTMRTLYATDASAYREMPLAVAFPKDAEDIKKLIRFARSNKTSLIPRTAGTSLAGQVVGKGIVVDVSRTFTKILEVNRAERWVRVQPGVVRDELNKYLEEYGLFYAPETSTANRAMVGGMIGNNSCGANSIIYGSAREHLIEVQAILSDGSDAVFNNLETEQFREKVDLGKSENASLENKIYAKINHILADESNQKEIRD